MFKMFAAKTINSHNASVFSVEHGTRMIYNYIYKKKQIKRAGRPTDRQSDGRTVGWLGVQAERETNRQMK